MTTFPNFLDHYARTLLNIRAATENPHHRALLETYAEVQQLEARLLDAVVAPHPQSGPGEKHPCTELLIDRLAAGQELAALLSAACCRPDGEEADCDDRNSCSPHCDPDAKEEADETPCRDCRRH
ncbi:hypothetical protein [Streptomyces roseoviridis]|uniref:Uncharacterized protein n=1 Tax=Streptomyces roseoviridis TaxID=67361 RepID=A0ABV5QTK9_9ACTN